MTERSEREFSAATSVLVPEPSVSGVGAASERGEREIGAATSVSEVGA